MCRWVAYSGTPVYLETLVAKPERSLISQSVHALEAKAGTNGDGFGLGWYGDHAEPGLFHETLPAWSDDNLLSLCRQIRSRLFFAHVRASTGTATTRANCHPFAVGPWLFMHNGQIGGYRGLRRDIDALIPEELYDYRNGTTDSEALFLVMQARGMADDPVGAAVSTLGTVAELQARRGIRAPIRFTAALTDGKRLFAFRCSSDRKAPSLYYRTAADGSVTTVSEPLDDNCVDWLPVPEGHVLIVEPGSASTLRPLTISAGTRSAA